MSDASTRRMIDAYVEEAPAPMFLTGMLRTPPQNFYDSEEVELDIQRETEEVAIVVQDLTAGARKVEAAKYTNKSFKAPVIQLEGVLTAYDLMKREVGALPFDDLNFQGTATRKALSISRKMEGMIRRAIELETAQMFQTGELHLIDGAGVELYTIDYQPKSTHFTTPTAWAADGSTGDPLAAIAALALILRRDGRKAPNRLVFGAGAWERFLANTRVKAQLDNLGMQNFQNIVPSTPGADGATFMGWITTGNYRFECWLYDGQYNHPQTGTLTPYIADNKVVMLSSKARYDLTFGNIPRFGTPESSALPYLPRRISGGGIDLHPWAFKSADGLHVVVQNGCRPLPIPTEVDTFGCITAY